MQNNKRIYTRTGDKGTAALLDGKRRNKDDIIFDVVGKNDELIVWLGDAYYQIDQLSWDKFKDIKSQIIDTQHLLFDLGSIFAGDKTSFPYKLVTQMEQRIDAMTEQLPPLKNFILPCGNPLASAFHHARVVCRELERNLAALRIVGKAPENNIYAYVNRLSDYLFTCARLATPVEVIHDRSFCSFNL